MLEKIIGKYIKGISDRLYKLENDFDRYETRLKCCEQYNKSRTDECAQLHRILENYIATKITYQNQAAFLKERPCVKTEFCLLYKNGKEYTIIGLRLDNPVFTERSDSNQNVVFVEDTVDTVDGLEYREYLIDLDKCTFIREK